MSSPGAQPRLSQFRMATLVLYPAAALFFFVVLREWRWHYIPGFLFLGNALGAWGALLVGRQRTENEARRVQLVVWLVELACYLTGLVILVVQVLRG